MDIRVLRYFLTIASVGNITRAADMLHITQPTLSRQMMDLEETLGTPLLVRGKRQVTLTNAGVLFQQRAQEIVQLLEKTERDLHDQMNLVGGTVSVGCVETVASVHLADALCAFATAHPLVRYELYGADGDDIREKLDAGLVDVGILLEPIETAKYDYFPLPYEETWGLVVPSGDSLAQRESVRMEDLLTRPLIMPRRRIVQAEIESWLDVRRDQLHSIASHNLLTNSLLLVKRGLGYVLCVQGAFTIRETEGVRFVPLSPRRTAGHVLAWKKNKLLNEATNKFIAFLKMQTEHDT